MIDQKYILGGKDGHEAVPVDLHTWGRWFEDKMKRSVRQSDEGEAHISTMFLGIDHNFGDDGPPLLFETMVFGGVHDESQWRYSTWDEAVAGHERAVALIRNETPEKDSARLSWLLKHCNTECELNSITYSVGDRETIDRLMSQESAKGE